MRFFLTSGASLSLLFRSFVAANIVYVPNNQPTIQSGIDAASPGDTVLVQPGTYVENIKFRGKAIVVGSLFLTTADTSYVSRTIIDGNKRGTVVIFEDKENPDAKLVGFTVTNGSSWSGGGILCHTSSPSLINVMVRDNSASVGGGISCQSLASPDLVDVVVRDNSAGTSGGGIYATNYSSPSLLRVRITGNEAKWYGAGLYCEDYSSPILENVLISDNRAEIGGGIFSRWWSSPDLVNVTVTANRATSYGSGIYCGFNSNPRLTNSIVWMNSPEEISFYSTRRPGTVLWDEWSEEIETRPGYILWRDWRNETDFNSGELRTSITITYSNVRHGSAGIGNYSHGLVVWLDGNMDKNPLFVDTERGDLHLQPTSPCADAGDPVRKYNDPDGSKNDMGAYGGPNGTW